MLFSQLRQNSPLYILHKDSTPYIEVGQVTNVTAPMPIIGTYTQIGQPMSYSVDVSARVGEQNVLYQKMPANCEVADFAANGNVFISCTRDGINTEIQAMRQRSADVLSSVEYHKGMINVCDKMIQQLNPEEAEKVAQQEEINNLKNQMADMSRNITELLRQNKELIAQIGEKASSSKN